MRIVACVAVLALAVVAGWCSAEEPADTRTYWVYEGGWFAKAKDGSWYELNELTYRKLGKASKFKEAKRTKEYVELYDEERKVAVRLGEEGAEVRVGDGADWEKLYTGRWKTPTPAE
jgi:hypothetical protein